jgi:hypothetical protein
MDNYNGNPEEEISALSLELLFSPGLFVIPSHEGKSKAPTESIAEKALPAQFSMERFPAETRLSESAATMFARMGQFIAGTLLPTIPMANTGTPAKYRVVFTSLKEAFSQLQTEDGIVVYLPDTETLAVSPEGKVKAAEALKRWAAACLQDMERKPGV